MSRHRCSKELYQAFLSCGSPRHSGVALSDVSPLELSHDSVSRWLKSRHLRCHEVWQSARRSIDIAEPCLLIADDTVLSKEHSKKIGLVHPQYSGNAHDVIPGIGLVNLLWHGWTSNKSLPVDYRIYDKDSDGKTKNTHLCDMLVLAKKRGLKPDAVVMDTWYSSLKNLKTIRDLGWNWVTPLRKNRQVNKGERIENVTIPDEGLQVHLRGYGWVWVFKFEAKNGRIDFVATNKENPTREDVEKIIRDRWGIEVYHRELKQTCGIQRCQARTARSQRNHICLAILAWINKSKIWLQNRITLYQQNWNIIKPAVQIALAQAMHAQKT